MSAAIQHSDLQSNQPAPAASAAARQSGARLEDRYAGALYELAAQAGAIDAIAGELAALQAAIDTAPDFARMLRNPVIGQTAQAKVLNTIASELGFSKVTQNFLQLLARKGRQAQLPQIIARYQAIAAAMRGELTATVHTAAPLTEPQQQQLVDMLSAKHQASVTLNTFIDPTLLGGFSVRIGSKLYDRTLASQLNRLMLHLKEAA